MRMAIGLEYTGTHYHGWQRQTEVDSVQERVEKALSAVADTPILVQCAGRTDKGVHASIQIIHFDTQVQRSERAWIWGGNKHLPRDIRLLWAKPVPENFHARYSATARRYRYLLLNQVQSSALLKGAISWDYRPLDLDKMRQGAQFLLGEHDFSSFRGAGCQAKAPTRCIQLFSIERSPIGLIVFDVTANAFLLHMVRNMVGSLLAVGAGEQTPEWIATLLEARDRRLADMTAHETGLYLVDVSYPGEFGLPKAPIGPWFCPP